MLRQIQTFSETHGEQNFPPLSISNRWLGVVRAALVTTPRRNNAVPKQAGKLFVVDAHHDDGRRFIVRSDELLTAFLEFEEQAKAL
jgi:hypothetical protein